MKTSTIENSKGSESGEVVENEPNAKDYESGEVVENEPNAKDYESGEVVENEPNAKDYESGEIVENDDEEVDDDTEEEESDTNVILVPVKGLMEISYYIYWSLRGENYSDIKKTKKDPTIRGLLELAGAVLGSIVILIAGILSAIYIALLLMISIAIGGQLFCMLFSTESDDDCPFNTGNPEDTKSQRIKDFFNNNPKMLKICCFESIIICIGTYGYYISK
jgi:hypothetical protein